MTVEQDIKIKSGDLLDRLAAKRASWAKVHDLRLWRQKAVTVFSTEHDLQPVCRRIFIMEVCDSRYVQDFDGK